MSETGEQIRSIFRQIWPGFHRHKPSVHLSSFHTFTNYWRLWTLSIFVLAATALFPLCVVTLINYQLIEKSVETELNLRTERLTASAKSAITFFMEERLDALIFTVNEMGYDRLKDNSRLNDIFQNLKLGFGGLSDLSVIDANGDHIAYAGPFNLEGKNYKNQSWFIQSLQKKYFVSEVFTGYRDLPHIIIAVHSISPDGAHFILRATLDTDRLIQKIASYKIGNHTDVFLVNQDGVLQTPSERFGSIFSQTGLRFPPNAGTDDKITIASDSNLDHILSGHSPIFTNLVHTPFVLVVQKQKQAMSTVWRALKRSINWTVGISVIFILLVVTIGSTFMVNKLYYLDRAKAQTMLKMEQSQQLASIGQLAAGVAHEINNPLAVISQTAGYVKDLFTFTKEPLNEPEIQENLDTILEAVDRCGTITQQLLGFVRQFDIRVRTVCLGKMVREVLSFHKKEAEYKRINVTVSIPEKLPLMTTDKGKLQQILVNLINNAFQAVDEDSCLDIKASQVEKEWIELVIQDTGCGIAEENLVRIAEPFFSTKQEKMGTGLGLSITYGLVKKLGGKISVQSTEGVGTSFTLTFPIRLADKE